jgi:hypothetical protein
MPFHSMIARLNETDPNNRAAGRLLPPDWREPGTLNVLALAQWGLEQGISVETPAATSVADDAVAARLTQMRAMDPVAGLRDVETDERGTTVLELDGVRSAKEAATMVLESIRASIER